VTRPLDIYLIGICGTGVGSLAGLLKQLGHRVRGSDEHVYPPMSDKLVEWGIPVLEGYAAAHLEPAPDLVVVGNVIRQANPEAVAARARSLRTLSMPEALAEFGIRDRHAIVVAGTHGKTTVTALLSHVAMVAGLEPSFLIGGAPVGFKESFRAGAGDLFIVEGDEYDTAYFDKGPKFVHYRPTTAVITSIEYDHADIYDSIEAVEASFRALVGKVPSHGHLVLWHGAERARRLAERHARTSRVTVYAEHPVAGADLWLDGFDSGPAGLTVEPIERGRSLGRMVVPLWGEFSAGNVLAVIAALRGVGVGAEALARGLASFAGVKRRLEVRGEPGGVTVVDDFGHHPTAVRVTLAAATTRWPGRRLWALLEPRSATSRRNVFQREWGESFAGAARVIIASHERLLEIPEGERFDPARLAADLCQRGIVAEAIAAVDDIVARVVAEARSGDVVLVFSNGAFGGLHGKLVAALAQRPPRTAS
jgi:UDP-N-acetylmuramate: L-alanyl-gamma-D-glutamyl-meso-diaminopimelate ligase